MKQSTMWFGTVLSVAGSLMAGQGAFAQAPGSTLVVVERATTNATPVHGGTGPDNVGDVLTFNNGLYDSGNKKKIGGDQGYCVRLVVGKSYECHWTNLLANGQISVDGPFHDEGDTELAIIGGTGAYSGARGEMLLHALDAKGTAYTFTFKFK